jgi:hypothetical protein
MMHSYEVLYFALRLITIIIWFLLGLTVLVILLFSSYPPCDSNHHERQVLGTTYCSENR